MNWKLLKKEIVFDKFMQIEQRQYALPNGDIKNFYIKLNKPCVCVLALTPDNQVITVQQYRPGPNKAFNELPGGFMEPDESPQAAAARELKEETGYQGDIQLVTECYDDAYVDVIRYCFVATNCQKVSGQQLDDSEFINLTLLSLPDFLKQVRSGQMTDVEVALLGLDYLHLLK